MKRLLILYSLVSFSLLSFGQESNQLLEEIVEQIAEDSDEELDYAELYEALYYFSENPINLNKTTKEELRELYFLNAYQIDKLLAHIVKNGKLLSHLELQTVAGFDVQTIQNLLPFISINPRVTSKQILANIKQYIIVRDQFYLQEQKGYIPDEDGDIHYLGNAHRTYFKYRLKNNYLQAGITAEKDAGENFLGPNQPYGFDFYSAHLQARNIGKIKNVIIGDYQMNFGQGVVMQSGMSFGKSSEVINIQKSGNLIKAHTAAAENLFFRGVAIQIEPMKNVDIITFISSHKVDANITDTLDNEELIFSSIQGSGMHRTESELLDKNVILQNHFGIHTNYNYQNLNLGLSYYNTKVEGIFDKNIASYNQFDFNGNTNQNFGVDYQYLYRNMNFFGEIGKSENGGTAHVNGVMMGLDKTISASILYRDYAKDYQSEYANAFGERSTQNEKGLYFGLEFIPNHKFKMKGYADNYEFPWLRFGVDAPSKGNDYLLQADYKINRGTKMYVRYKSETKEDQLSEKSTIAGKRKDNFRFHINYKDGDNWSFANRFETSYISFDNEETNGYMLYQDVKYKPLFGKFTFTSRYVLFNAPEYDNRIYAYENDVLYGYSIPAYYGIGNKFYLVAKYNPIRNVDIWLRIAHTSYTDRAVVKSGWDEINGNKMTEVKLQMRYKF
ncbi:MAG: helix-hairpin-helix domain-containing protein [Flavobacteriales bacterium]|nr:helix-hairpin-helix domain-containing protein [Flavobacteriales bacterium]